MNTKEQWISETLESLDGMRRAGSDPETYEKVMQRIRMSGTRRVYLQASFVWKIAAGLILLIGLNVFSLVYYSRLSKASETQTGVLASDYFSYINTIKL
ncbi:MAG: hypothetical protein NTU98_11385 [Bacteroidetes bacterium]|nr:hypothetical protein [Bacteroidota bacterium]